MTTSATRKEVVNAIEDQVANPQFTPGRVGERILAALEAAGLVIVPVLSFERLKAAYGEATRSDGITRRTTRCMVKTDDLEDMFRYVGAMSGWAQHPTACKDASKGSSSGQNGQKGPTLEQTKEPQP
jgi:hypothetical protein